MRDHGLQHLGGNDDGSTAFSRQMNQFILGDRDFFRRQLDAQVAARHHNRVSDVEYRLRVLERFRLLDLGDNLGIVVVLPQQFAQPFDI